MDLPPPLPLLPPPTMSAVAARKAALLLQRVTPDAAPPSRPKTYAKKDKQRSRGNSRRRETQDDDVAYEPEDRVVVEIDVINIRSEDEQVEEQVEESLERAVEEAVNETVDEQPTNTPAFDSTSELDFQESGILANARPRKKRRIDSTPGEPVSSYTPVQGVNIHRLSGEDVERAWPSLPRRKAVLLLLKPDEVSPRLFPITFLFTFSVEHRPRWNSSNHPDSRHPLPLLIHHLPDSGTDLPPTLCTAYAPTTHTVPVNGIINNPPPGYSASPPADVPRPRTGPFGNPRPRSGTRLGARYHARSCRRLASDLSRG